MNEIAQLKKLRMLCEDRNPELEYEDIPEKGKTSAKVIARLKSYKSQSMTKLAQKIQRIDQLETEINTLKAEVKDETKTEIAGLFDDLEDLVKTRVVETVSFVFTLSKNPAETISPKYKDILEKLSTHLTPELITILEGLKATLVTKTLKSPSLKIEPVTESIGSGFFSKLKNLISRWAVKYDSKLEALKREAGVA